MNIMLRVVQYRFKTTCFVNLHMNRVLTRFYNSVSVSIRTKAPVTPGLRPGYDLPAIGKCWNRGRIVERTHDWSERS